MGCCRQHFLQRPCLLVFDCPFLIVLDSHFQVSVVIHLVSATAAAVVDHLVSVVTADLDLLILLLASTSCTSVVSPAPTFDSLHSEHSLAFE